MAPSKNEPYFKVIISANKMEKEDMERREELTSLIKFLAGIPNSDEHIGYVLKLAEESATNEKLQNLIEKNNVAIKSDVKEERLDDILELKFTNKEINQMPKAFRKEFRVDGCTARIRKKPSGKSGYIYEIRYRRNGYDIGVRVDLRFYEFEYTQSASVQFGFDSIQDRKSTRLNSSHHA